MGEGLFVFMDSRRLKAEAQLLDPNFQPQWSNGWFPKLGYLFRSVNITGHPYRNDPENDPNLDILPR